MEDFVKEENMCYYIGNLILQADKTKKILFKKNIEVENVIFQIHPKTPPPTGIEVITRNGMENFKMIFSLREGCNVFSMSSFNPTIKMFRQVELTSFEDTEFTFIIRKKQ